MSKILQPLVDHQALAFVSPDEGPALRKNSRVDLIYFTGGAPTATAIRKTTSVPLVCEAGGVNPQIIVPGQLDDCPVATSCQSHCQHGQVEWRSRVCSPPSVLWLANSGRNGQNFSRPFAKPLKRLPLVWLHTIREPRKSWRSLNNTILMPNAFVLRVHPTNPPLTSCGLPILTMAAMAVSEKLSVKSFAKLPWIVNLHEFIQTATHFCNTQVTGTLVAGITIDPKSERKYKAVTELKYGSVGINMPPLMVFFTPHLVWGGSDDSDGPVVSGNGNFGNLFGYYGVKSIVRNRFWSPNH